MKKIILALVILSCLGAHTQGCGDSKSSPIQWQCDFDGSPALCGMTQSTSDQEDWTMNTGGTDSDDTGPDGDHTTGTGNYIYFEASGVATGNIASISTPTLSGAASYCITFWYHMLGEDIGTLNVTAANGADSTLLWSRARVQGNMWLCAEVDLVSSTSVFVEFTASKDFTTGEPYGDIALDDITVYGGACSADTSVTPEQPATTTPTDGPVITTTTTERPVTTNPPTDRPTTTNPPTDRPTTTNPPTDRPITTTHPSDGPETATSNNHTTTAQSTPTVTSVNGTEPQSTSGSMSSSLPSSTERPSGTTSPAGDARLWGVTESVWIIIFAVAGVILLVLIGVVIAQCFMLPKHKDQSLDFNYYDSTHSSKTKQNNDFITAYDNVELEQVQDNPVYANGSQSTAEHDVKPIDDVTPIPDDPDDHYPAPDIVY